MRFSNEKALFESPDLDARDPVMVEKKPNWGYPTYNWGTISGWWLTYPFEQYEFVSWDYEIPSLWKVIKFMFQTTNQ